MPVPIFAVLLGVVGAALVGVAVYFWPNLMGWAQDHLLPWVDRNLPMFSDDVRLAFKDLDNAAVSVRKNIRTAWRKLRTVLLAETAEFVRLFNNEWAVRITSYVNAQEQASKPIARVVTEQRLGWDELPDDIRRQALANGLDGRRIDILAARDQLLSETH